MSTYSPDLRIELIDTGAQPGQWGTTTNNTWAYLIDPAISGYQIVSVTNANQALTWISGSSTTASANQSVYASLEFTTSLGTAFTIYAPPNSKQYILWNNSAQSMTITNSSVIGNTTPSGGTTVTIPAGKKAQVFSDGYNFRAMDADSLIGTLAVENGGTGVATLTGVVYGNGTSDFSAATGSQIAAAIGSATVTNATNATNVVSGGTIASNVTGTTQAASDNSTKIATTAYVDQAAAPTSATSKIQPITASVAGNNLTLTLNPTTLDFRSTVVGSGAVSTVSVSSAISLTVPAGATLGTVSTVAARLILVAINNAGTAELAVINLAGGTNLDETGLVTTTAISGFATANNVMYSTTARSNVAYRVVGFINITETTAGSWATAPSTIQGMGGQALTALSSLGYGQTWQPVTRSLGTTYYNTTGKPITFAFLGNTNGAGGAYAYMTMNGFNVSFANCYSGGGGYPFAGSVVIPAGISYVFNISITAGSPSVSNTYELR